MPPKRKTATPAKTTPAQAVQGDDSPAPAAKKQSVTGGPKITDDHSVLQNRVTVNDTRAPGSATNG